LSPAASTGQPSSKRAWRSASLDAAEIKITRLVIGLFSRSRRVPFLQKPVRGKGVGGVYG
jgi:hypothetical protein